jgi:hypothetical protein
MGPVPPIKAMIISVYSVKVKVKLSLQQAVKAYRVVRC